PGWPDRLDCTGNVWRSQQVTKAQAWKSVFLRQRTQDDQIVVRCEEALAVPAVGGECSICFIEHHQPVWLLAQKPLDLSLAVDESRRIVRVTHEEHANGREIAQRL